MVCYDPYTTELYPQNQTIMPVAIQLTPQTAAEEAFEREKAAITSYEEGWDRWDGPIWPVGYVQCRMRKYFLPSCNSVGIIWQSLTGRRSRCLSPRAHDTGCSARSEEVRPS